MEDFRERLSTFQSVLDTTSEKLWCATNHFPDQLEVFVKGSKTLVEEVIKIGDWSYEQLQTLKGIEKRNCYLATFLWPEHAKSFLILWRDIFFQQQKAQILLADAQIEQAAIDQLNQQSKEILTRVREELNQFWQEETSVDVKGRKGNQNQIEQWQLQINPWPTYKKQLEEIPQQCQQLSEQYQSLKNLSGHLSQIRQDIQDLLDTFAKAINSKREEANGIIDFIDENMEEKAGKIATYIESSINKKEVARLLKKFPARLEKKLDTLTEKMQVPVTTEGGLLLYKEIYFQRGAKQWMESEILPMLYESDELSENIFNAYKLALANISNRAILVSSEVVEGQPNTQNKEDLRQPLLSFLNKLEAWEKEFNALRLSIKERLDTYFYLSPIYQSDQDFLPIPLQSTINQLKSNQNVLLVNIQRWLKKQMRAIRKIRTTVEREESLSASEKIVRFIQRHTVDSPNHNYRGIFLTKGYIGETFWVGRKTELRRFKKLVDQWQFGFRGAVMLSGQRFSGKSLFGDLATNRFFPNHTIRLSPNTSIEVQGRIFQTTYDLDQALEFIRKYAIPNKHLVWIDDLELWRDLNTPLHQNVRALCRHIDNYSSRIFFLVSISNWAKERLEKVSQVSKVFQTEINLDRMLVEEIRQAILIRHGATHKTLVNQEGSESSPQQFSKITNKVFQYSDGNIGEALQQWAFSIQKIDEKRVIFKQVYNYSLPDFLQPDSALLLATLMMEKRSNEHHLRKLFGPAFNEKYRSLVQRLISVGLLTRHPDGWLEINEVAANEVGLLLERKKYLKFHH